MTWTSKERFAAICAGEPAERPVISAWRHFRDEEYSSTALAHATAEFATTWDLDWIKLNPRAVYYGEIWGNQYEVGHYAERDIPLQREIAITEVSDLGNINTTSSAASSALQEQVDLVRNTHRLLPEKPLMQTIFSPLSVLFQLAGLSYYNKMPVFGKSSDLDVMTLLTSDKALTHQALQNITETFASHFSDLMNAGATGIFYAVTGTANEELVSKELFEEFSAPYDHEILSSLSDDIPRILHTCGDASHPEKFADYPVNALSWDHFASNNPVITEDLGHTFAGGADHRQFQSENVATLEEQIQRAVDIYRNKPYLLVPTCSIRSNAISDDAMRVFQKATERK